MSNKINKIVELIKEKNELVHKIDKFYSEMEAQKKEFENAMKEMPYKAFVQENGEFLARFMNEYLSQNLKVHMNCNPDEEIVVKLSLNDETFSSDSDYVDHTDTTR